MAQIRGLPLVGRGNEVAALRVVAQGGRRGGRIAVVEGEAGIGKTRVIEAVGEAARGAGMTVLSSRAEELEAHRPFGAIVDIAGGERLDGRVKDRELRPVAGSEGEFRVADRVLEMLDVRCRRGPVMLVVEDLQWADPCTLAVLARVATGIDRLPVALVVSGRSEPRRAELERLLAVLAGRGASWVHLGPLDERFSVELVEALVGERPGPRLIDQVRRAGGNPLFVCELVGALLADGAIVSHDGGAELAADAGRTSLSLTILHRLSFLPDDVLDLLGLASVLGATFVPADLALLTGRTVAELVPALRSARRAGVLGEHGERLAFRHELVRDALYDDMPLPVRRSLHGELARILADAGEPIERRIEHLVRATAPGDEPAIRSVIDAARDLVSHTPSAAVDAYRQAIELSALPEVRRAQLLPELAEALVSAGLLGEGEAACREALGHDLDPHRAGRLRLRLISLLLRRARAAEAAGEAEAARADPRISAPAQARMEALGATARVFSGDAEPAIRAARAVLEASDDDLARAMATNAVAMAAVGRGAYAEAAAVIAPSVQWAERTRTSGASDTHPHLNLAAMLIRVDRLDDADVTILRGRRGAETLGMADILALYHSQAGYVDFVRGRLDDALAALASHTQLLDPTSGWQVPAHGVRALIAIHRDDLLAAERHVAAAEREVAAGAVRHGTELMVLARARLLEATGDAITALTITAREFEAMAAAGMPTYHPLLGPDLARLAVLAGRPDRVERVIHELRRIAELNPGVRSLEASALQADGLLRSDADALLAAVDLLRGTGRDLETARAAEDAAAAGINVDDLLAEARAIYERCGATRDLARVDAARRRRGTHRGTIGPRRRPDTGWDALTDAEHAVVRLVAERLTNPEIAARLFISRRTVQTHVSHALAKVGVTTRRELAAVAARRAGWQLQLERVG